MSPFFYVCQILFPRFAKFEFIKRNKTLLYQIGREARRLPQSVVIVFVRQILQGNNVFDDKVDNLMAGAGNILSDKFQNHAADGKAVFFPFFRNLRRVRQRPGVDNVVITGTVDNPEIFA